LKEWKGLLSDLEDHYSVFSSLYSAGRPKFSTELPTAAVYFNRAGNCVDFKANPDFWKTLSREKKRFVLSHEALHIFLNHGRRFKDVNPKEAVLANLALDVVVNHTLVDKFRHVRKQVDAPGNLCWLDTVFKGQKDVKAGQNYEYYMALLRQKRKDQKQNPDKSGQNGEGGQQGGEGESGHDPDKSGQNPAKPGQLINDHEGLKSFGKPEENDQPGDQPGGPQRDKQLEDFLKKALGKEGLEELAEKLGGQMAGTEAGNLRRIIEEMDVKPKRKWETVIRDWALQFRDTKEADQFILTNRRYAMMPRNKTFLPTEGEIDASDKKRIEVWFFIDTSGSCYGLAPRFFSAAMSLPKDRFSVKLFCFDTKVYEVDPIKRELSGFGGTSFACIETEIQRRLLFGEKAHPKAVWVLTDGYSESKVSPQMANRWHWFLTCDYREYIPAESTVWKLEDFE
jgi:predicted metal-dependent peptidase